MIDIEAIKSHLQIEGITADDEYLKGLSSAVVSILEEDIKAQRCELNRREMAIFDQAFFLLLGDYYKHREDTTDLAVNRIPYGVQRLCDLIRRYNR